ncbi:hypothetical protein SB2_11765 [Methylobacterium radiotolerans]|nr:hypothetical protein SB3_10960 [Methylobacterium radiotolerans]KTS47970.1 hypothetical protein SB2_11765 [Methylobacterium radiotolerans]
MIKVTNIAPGPRGIHVGGAIVMLQPGETQDLDVADADAGPARKSGWFMFEGDSAKDKAATVDAMSDDELKALLSNKGVQVDGRWGHDKLVAEAKKVLG